MKNMLRKLIIKIFNIGGKGRCGRDYGSRANIHQGKSIGEYVKVFVTAKRCKGCSYIVSDIEIFAFKARQRANIYGNALHIIVLNDIMSEDSRSFLFFLLLAKYYFCSPNISFEPL